MTASISTVALALDRLPSTRIYDKNGHLHVQQVHISKAAVNDYLGSEISNARELGLDVDRVYRLLRDPRELAKAAPSFNNKPLLFGHNPVHADNHDHARTVGAISNIRWNDPYLDADLACWSGPAIDCIKDDSQKELSSAYHYRCVMEPGTYQGERYDGRMVEIAGNHVSLVPKGRVGADCVVSDSAEAIQQHLAAAQAALTGFVAASSGSDATNGRAGPHIPAGVPTRIIIMAKQALSGAAAHTQGALATYLKPKLAQDAKVDLGPLLSGITAKNFAAHKPALVLGLKQAVRGKLAQDEDVEDIGELVDDIGEAVVEAVAEQTGKTEEEVAAEAAATAEKKDGDETAQDDADMAALKAMLKDELGLDDEQIGKVCAKVAEIIPAPSEIDAVTPAGTVVGDAKPSKAAKPALDGKTVTRADAERMARDAAATAAKGKVDQVAMDRAIAAAVAGERQRQTDLRGALDFVRPWVGQLAVACDSAEAVHRATLTTLGIDHKGVDASALKTIIGLAPKPGDAPRRSSQSAALAQDAANGRQTYDEMFPNAGRLAS